MRRTIILAAALGIIVIGLWGSFVLLFDETRLKGIVAERLSDGLGRKVEIVGAISLSLFPQPRIEAERVLIGSREGIDGPELISADELALSLRVSPLIRGRLVPGQVRLKGATVSLNGSDRGGAARELARVASNASRLTEGEISLEDVTLLITRDDSRRPDQFEIQRIELAQFVMDRNAAFRFRGSIVDPPLVEDLRVDADLHVPSRSSEAVELRNLRIDGRLPPSGRRARLAGDLRIDRDGEFGFELLDATLELGGQALGLEGSYRATGRPQLELVITGTAFDWPALVSAWPVQAGRLWQAPLFVARHLDLDARIRLQSLGTSWLPLSHLRVDLRTESSGLGVALAAGFPGGLIEAGGVISDRLPDTLPVDIALADAAALFEAAALPPVIDASGEARLNLQWPSTPDLAPALEGRFRLLDGRWEVIDEAGSPQTLAFDELSGRMLLRGGHLDLPALRIIADTLDASGWAAVELSSGAIGGQLEARQSGDSVTLAGSVAETRLLRSPGPVAEPEATGEADELAGKADDPEPDDPEP